jgi:hypothetical protein
LSIPASETGATSIMIADHQNADRAEELRELRMKLLQAIVKNERRRRPQARLACNIGRATGRVIFERVPPRSRFIEKELVAH